MDVEFPYEVKNSPEIGSSAADGMEYEEAPSVDWSRLPPLVLERIYSFLGRKDQGSMSQVCKTWSQEYSSPILWREITFNLPEHALTTDMHPAVRSAQRYARFFRHVRIVRRGGVYGIIKVIHKQLKLFLQFLAQDSQLLSFSCLGLKLCSCFCRGQSLFMVSDIQQSLVYLMSQQNKLQSVNFEGSRLENPEALHLLHTILSRNVRTLKNLALRGFKCVYLVRYLRDHFTLHIDTLMNLKSLKIDYMFHFEEIVTKIYERGRELQLRGKGNLRSLTLFHDFDIIYRSYPNGGIKPEAWKYFREVFPSVELDVIIRLDREDQLSLVLVRHMPVTFLNLATNLSAGFELGTILRHLTECGINRNLKRLIIRVEKAENLAQDLLNFLDWCLVLEVLQLDFWSRVVGLDAIFEYWLENGPHPKVLNTVYFTIETGNNGELISAYKNLADEYVPLMENLGITVSLSAT